MEEVLWRGYISKGCSIKDDGSGLIVMGNLDFDGNGNSDIFLFKTDYEGQIIENSELQILYVNKTISKTLSLSQPKGQ